jgi:hypothetical protein
MINDMQNSNNHLNFSEITATITCILFWSDIIIKYLNKEITSLKNCTLNHCMRDKQQKVLLH